MLGLLCPRGGALWPVSNGQFGRRNSHQSQLFLWLSPPVQWIAHARVLPRGHGIRDRDRTSRPNQTRRAEGGSRVHLARVPSTRAMGKRRSSSIPAQKRRSVMRSCASVPARTPNPAPLSSTTSPRRGQASRADLRRDRFRDRHRAARASSLPAKSSRVASRFSIP